MKWGITLLAMFVVGIFIGMSGVLPDLILNIQWSNILLYVLIAQVGLGIGVSGNIGKLLKGITTTTLLLPLCTVAGTLAGTALICILIDGFNLTECLSMNSGLGYYSLSSVLISDIKTPMVGMQRATELGVLALMVNILRELLSLVFAPLIGRYCGGYALISASGVTSVDVLMPSIIKYSGVQMMPVALVHGGVLEVLVPVMVCYFSSF